MSSGLYAGPVIIERSLASVATGNLVQVFVAPADLVVVGLLAYTGTAPGGSTSLTVNISNSPTSQLNPPSGAANQSVVAYSLWTSTNVPTITGTAKFSTATTNTTTVIENVAYALNYPLPGATGAGTTGFITAQQTTLGSNANAVSSPPKMYEYALNSLVAPDNTYLDLNNQTQSAALVHAGDVLTFVVGGAAGSAANLQITLFTQKN
jgi:hypothetical protein